MKGIVILYVLVHTTLLVSAQQNINVQQNLNINLPIIEKKVYVDRYRTVYIDKPQSKRVSRKLTAPIKLLGYLWVYPEDLGNFKQQPLSIISSLNSRESHGRNNWRIPTPDELAVLEANANEVGLGEDIYLASDHSNGVLRLVSTDETDREKALRLNNGILIGNTIWSAKNIGARDIDDSGRNFTFSEAINACPKGWRLPTKSEYNDLLNSGEACFGFRERTNAKIVFPHTTSYSGNYGNSFEGQYWIQDGEIQRSSVLIFRFERYVSAGGYGNPYNSSHSAPDFERIGTNDKGVSVRCVLNK